MPHSCGRMWLDSFTRSTNARRGQICASRRCLGCVGKWHRQLVSSPSLRFSAWEGGHLWLHLEVLPVKTSTRSRGTGNSGLLLRRVSGWFPVSAPQPGEISFCSSEPYAEIHTHPMRDFSGERKVLCPCAHFLLYPENVSSNVSSREKRSLSTPAGVPRSGSTSHQEAVHSSGSAACSPARGSSRQRLYLTCLCHRGPSVLHRECAGLNDKTQGPSGTPPPCLQSGA